MLSNRNEIMKVSHSCADQQMHLKPIQMEQGFTLMSRLECGSSFHVNDVMNIACK